MLLKHVTIITRMIMHHWSDCSCVTLLCSLKNMRNTSMLFFAIISIGGVKLLAQHFIFLRVITVKQSKIPIIIYRLWHTDLAKRVLKCIIFISNLKTWSWKKDRLPEKLEFSVDIFWGKNYPQRFLERYPPINKRPLSTSKMLLNDKWVTIWCR